MDRVQACDERRRDGEEHDDDPPDAVPGRDERFDPERHEHADEWQGCHEVPRARHPVGPPVRDVGDVRDEQAGGEDENRHLGAVPAMRAPPERHGAREREQIQQGVADEPERAVEEETSHAGLRSGTEDRLLITDEEVAGARYEVAAARAIAEREHQAVDVRDEQEQQRERQRAGKDPPGEIHAWRKREDRDAEPDAE